MGQAFSSEDALREAMRADAVIVAKATAHWREAENLGVAPPNKGVMRPGGLPARVIAALGAREDACGAEIAAELGAPLRRVNQAIQDLRKRDLVRSVAPGRYALTDAGRGVVS